MLPTNIFQAVLPILMALTLVVSDTTIAPPLDLSMPKAAYSSSDLVKWDAAPKPRSSIPKRKLRQTTRQEILRRALKSRNRPAKRETSPVPAQCYPEGTPLPEGAVARYAQFKIGGFSQSDPKYLTETTAQTPLQCEKDCDSTTDCTIALLFYPGTCYLYASISETDTSDDLYYYISYKGKTCQEARAYAKGIQSDATCCIDAY